MRGQRFLDEVRTVMRRQHDSMHTERGYCGWVAQYVKFHRMRSRQEVVDAGGPHVEAFLTHLAKVKRLHEQDLADGFGEVYLPHALSRQRPDAAVADLG